MTEKRVAHYPLARVRSLVDDGKVCATRTALQTAAGLQYSFEDMVNVIRNLTPSNLWKSMTSHADHTVWQDVYHFSATDGLDIYLKLTVIDNVLIVSFKEL